MRKLRGKPGRSKHSAASDETTSLTSKLKEWFSLLAGDWTMEILEEHIFSVVLLPDHGDRFCPSYLVEETADGFSLHAHRWDEMHRVGVFGTLSEALDPVKAAAIEADFIGPMQMN